MQIQFTRKLLYQMCFFTLIVFSLVGYLIYTLTTGNHFSELLIDKASLWEQILAGSTAGIGGFIIILAISQFTVIDDSTGFLTDLLKKINPNIHEIIFFSFCAAVGEEILFRGAIQHWIGIWPTAILFVAVHGYLSIKNWGLTIVGVALVFVSAAFGYLMVKFGITAAIIAHFLYDVLTFLLLKFDED